MSKRDFIDTPADGAYPPGAPASSGHLKAPGTGTAFDGAVHAKSDCDLIDVIGVDVGGGEPKNLFDYISEISGKK